jgi:7-keto-8-aminopelargonate synthetase-like enzyme/prephenate dehydrogenase
VSVETLRRCVVAGGAGAVGGMFASLFAEAGAEVVVVDVAPPAASNGGGRVRVVQGDITTRSPHVLDELREADMVMLAVPEAVAMRAIAQVANAIPEEALLADTLSVKSRFATAVRAVGRGDVVSLNPMFAPSLGIAGRPVAAVVIHDGPRAQELLRLVSAWGGRVVSLDAERHDRLTAAAQVLTHASVIAFGLALSELDVDIDELTSIAPPPHSSMLALLGRITSGNPELYWDIQARNPSASAVRAALARGVHRLMRTLDSGGSAGFLDAIRQAGDALGSRREAYAEACARLFEALTPAAPARANWVQSRVGKTSDALDRAFDEGLTGHVFTAREGKHVRLEDGTEAIEFVSCSYLGLEEHPALIGAAMDGLRRFGAHFSSSRNRMRPPYLAELEALLAEIYLGNHCVAFTSVGNVHLGLLPLLASGALPSYPIRRGGAAFAVEKTAHASMQVLRGIFEQIGPVHRFDLADDESLPRLLRNAVAQGRTPIVLVDGVGSMGGLIDVVSLYRLVEEHGGHLYVDDAHGISLAGARGAGYAFEQFGRLAPNLVLAGSLSKAFGGAGGFAVVPSQADVQALRKFANPLVFGHSIMLPMLAADVAAARLHVDGEVATLQERLWRNTERFDALTDHLLVNAGLRSPVRGALYATEEEAFAAAQRLRSAGVLVLPAFFPTVAKGTGLIRFAISSLHEPAQLELAASALAGAGVAA